MKAILKWVGIVLGALVLMYIGWNAAISGTIRADRSTLIDRDPAAVYAVVNDHNQFANWSPWQKLDPYMKVTTSDPATGTGATYAWDSPNDSAGAGKITTTLAKPNELVAQKLEFIRPFESTATDTVFLTPEGSGTRVRWTMESEMPFLFRWMAAGQSEALGKDYDEGLANLKRVLERQPAAAPTDSTGANSTAADTTAASAPAVQ